MTTNSPVHLRLTALHQAADIANLFVNELENSSFCDIFQRFSVENSFPPDLIDSVIRNFLTKQFQSAPIPDPPERDQ